VKRLLLLPLIITLLVAIYFAINNDLFLGIISDQKMTEAYTEDLVMPEEISQKEPEKRYITSIDIDYLRSLNIDSPAPQINEELAPGTNYKRYLASYYSEGSKIYGLLTVPNEEAPENGYPAIVFNHGYIPPNQYSTTEKYVAYVDNLARNGFVVFKIDLRGHGESGGIPNGSYFSNGYTVDAIHALKALQKLDYVNPDRIGMWGHSMAGNLVMRALLVEDDIKAAVIWAGAVYSYEDFAEYRLNDTSYVRREVSERERRRRYGSEEITQEVEKLRENPEEIDFDSEFWQNISLTANINYLNAPVQLHHAVNDPVVNIGYTRDLVEVLEQNNKDYEVYEYEGGGHNINSPYFESAIARTVAFFQENL
jgi:dipeptidyl aminopeptidase/acylaminoacyl peptidase